MLEKIELEERKAIGKMLAEVFRKKTLETNRTFYEASLKFYDNPVRLKQLMYDMQAGRNTGIYTILELCRALDVDLGLKSLEVVSNKPESPLKIAFKWIQ